MDMKSDGPWNDECEGSPEGDHALESMLRQWGEANRANPELASRVAFASATALARGTRNTRLARVGRWSGGLAVAASIVLALFIGVDSPTVLTGPNLAHANSGGAPSEALLVSLLAGSEAVSHQDPADAELDVDGAMPLLRARDTTFGDLHSEVALLLAVGGQP